MPRPVLRGYQIDCVERTREAFKSAHRVVMVVPTGGGKTVIAGSIIDSAIEKGGRVLFLAHRKELIDQCSSKLCDFGISHGVIKAGVRPDYGATVQVASVQTISRRLDRLTGNSVQAINRSVAITGLQGAYVPPDRRPFTLAVIDECHHITARTYQDTLAAWPRARWLGLTATPYRIDGKALGECFEKLVVGATVPQLIAAGFLVPTRTFAPPPPADLRELRTLGGDFVTSDAADVLDRTGPTREIVEHWLKMGSDRLSVGFGCTVAHCERLAAAFREVGVAATTIDGAMPPSQREDILGDYRAGKYRIVFNVSILTEGFDLPGLSCLIGARPTKSRALWRQMVGRIMRPSSGKDYGLILDHAANGHRFGVPDQPDHYELHSEKVARATRGGGGPRHWAQCSKCFRIEHGRPLPTLCPTCGTVLVEPRASRTMAPQRDEHDLGELEAATEAERYAWYLSCCLECDEKNKQPGWVYYRYIDRWGQKPDAWMPVKANFYQRVYKREPPAGLVKVAAQRGNREEVLA